MERVEEDQSNNIRDCNAFGVFEQGLLIKPHKKVACFYGCLVPYAPGCKTPSNISTSARLLCFLEGGHTASIHLATVINIINSIAIISF